MIGSFLKFTRSAYYWMCVVVVCALAQEPLAAKDVANPSLEKTYNTPTRPATELLGRSLGLTAGVLAVGAVALLVSRKYSSKLLLDQGLGQKASAGQRPRVTGRVRLTPRQTVHVLAIGQRVLVLGTGPQGAPELLTEWAVEEDEAQDLPLDELDEPNSALTLNLPAEAAA